MVRVMDVRLNRFYGYFKFYVLFNENLVSDYIIRNVL